MYRVVLILVVAVVVAKAEMDEKCIKIFHPHTAFCCVNPPSEPLEKLQLEECSGLPIEPYSTCERDACMAKKKGFALADGKIDKKAIQNILEKKLENKPELLNIIKDKCIDGDINLYTPEDFCDAIKIRNCMHLQFIKQCPEFSDEGDCSGTTALVEECSKIFP